MNILEPLYEICIERMQEFNRENPARFKEELAEITDKYRSNIQYFIFKSIILRNLYGVDIMVEATEIAKLRLFLKMVAVVDVERRAENLGLAPLPDIDFNIRCGNTLVGYATKAQLDKDLGHAEDILQDIANQDFKQQIDAEMQKVAAAYRIFVFQQLRQEEDMMAFKQTKHDLRELQKSLNDKLNRRLYSATSPKISYEEWLKSHQPFNWLAEFYQIIEGNGGFDVIIGNPPYVNINQVSYIGNSTEFSCQDLYGFVLRRIQEIISKEGYQGMIIMHNIAFSRDFKNIRYILTQDSSSTWWSFFSRIPSGLFDGSVRVRNAIFLKNMKGVSMQYSTRLHRWFSYQRPNLFKLIEYGTVKVIDAIPMTSIYNLLSRINSSEYSIAHSLSSYERSIYYKGVGYNWITLTEEPPHSIDENGRNISLDSVGTLTIKQDDVHNAILVTCGKLGFINWITYGDDFHVTKKDILSIPIPSKLLDIDRSKIESIYKQFQQGLTRAFQTKLNAGKTIGSYNIASLWELTDSSDFVFVKYIAPTWSDEDLYLINNEVVKTAISIFKE